MRRTRTHDVIIFCCLRVRNHFHAVGILHGERLLLRRKTSLRLLRHLDACDARGVLRSIASTSVSVRQHGARGGEEFIALAITSSMLESVRLAVIEWRMQRD